MVSAAFLRRINDFAYCITNYSINMITPVYIWEKNDPPGFIGMTGVTRIHDNVLSIT